MNGRPLAVGAPASLAPADMATAIVGIARQQQPGEHGIKLVLLIEQPDGDLQLLFRIQRGVHIGLPVIAGDAAVEGAAGVKSYNFV